MPCLAAGQISPRNQRAEEVSEACQSASTITAYRISDSWAQQEPTLVWMAMASRAPAVSMMAAMVSRRNPIQREVLMKQNHQAPFASRALRNAS